jgi:hypothetical protein
MINNRYTFNQPSIVVINQDNGSVAARLSLPGEKKESDVSNPLLISGFNQARLRRIGEKLIALRTVTGDVDLLNSGAASVAGSFRVPKVSSFEAAMTPDGGIAVNYAAFDIASFDSQLFLVLSNGFNPYSEGRFGYLTDQNGSVVREIRLSPEVKPSSVAADYDTAVQMDSASFLLLSSLAGRADLFSVSEK